MSGLAFAPRPAPVLPTAGVEVELAIFKPGHPVGKESPLPEAVLVALAKTQPSVHHAQRDGSFFREGLAYREMGRLLEVASAPASVLEDVLRAEEAALDLARRGCRALGSRLRGACAACLADDLAGPPAARPGRAADRDSACSTSMGTHFNIVLPEVNASARDLFVLLAALLSEIVGPGGFIVDARSGALRFWRDPRAAHVTHAVDRSAHDSCRPILKLVADPRRLQIVSLGWTAGRIDRTIKYGLFLLLAVAVLRRDPLPHLAIAARSRIAVASPGRQILYTDAGHRARATRLDLLERLLDTVLTPAFETPEGQALGCGEALGHARNAIAACREARQPGDVARRIPLAWALKERAFAAAHTAAGTRLWRHGDRRPSPPRGDALDRQLALLSILEGNILDDAVRRWLVATAAPSGWGFDEIYALQSAPGVTDDCRPISPSVYERRFRALLETRGPASRRCTWEHLAPRPSALDVCG